MKRQISIALILLCSGIPFQVVAQHSPDWPRCGGVPFGGSYTWSIQVCGRLGNIEGNLPIECIAPCGGSHGLLLFGRVEPPYILMRMRGLPPGRHEIFTVYSGTWQDNPTVSDWSRIMSHRETIETTMINTFVYFPIRTRLQPNGPCRFMVAIWVDGNYQGEARYFGCPD